MKKTTKAHSSRVEDLAEHLLLKRTTCTLPLKKINIFSLGAIYTDERKYCCILGGFQRDCCHWISCVSLCGTATAEAQASIMTKAALPKAVVPYTELLVSQQGAEDQPRNIVQLRDARRVLQGERSVVGVACGVA